MIIDAVGGRVTYSCKIPLDSKVKQLLQTDQSFLQYDTTDNKDKSPTDITPAAITPELSPPNKLNNVSASLNMLLNMK